MSKSTNHLMSELSSEELGKYNNSGKSIDACVRRLLDEYTKTEYGGDFNRGNFEIIKPLHDVWKTCSRPKRSWFSRSKTSETFIEVTLIKFDNHPYFDDSNHMFHVEFWKYADFSNPKIYRVIRFCIELSKATGLPVRAKAGSQADCFYGYWDDDKWIHYEPRVS